MLDATCAQPEVLHHDDQLLVIHKPPGLPTTAPTAAEPCLVRWVREQFPNLEAHATSRLDSQVSGLVTFALTRRMNRHLLEARRNGSYERVYLGITLHELDQENGEWTWSISIDPRNPKRRVAGPGRGARAALTRYRVVGRTASATLLSLIPETGRTHQLRVHAARAGAPLLGDHGYQGERRKTLPDGRVITARRVMLHCARVGFPGPAKGARFQLEAPVRQDMRDAWLALGGAAGELQV